MLKSLLLVFAGGGMGSALRFLITRYLRDGSAFPQGTFVVNIIGSLILGFILGWLAKQNLMDHPLYFLIAIGFCGGFTTFSSFSFENFDLLKNGDYLNFAIYFMGSTIVGILAVFIGMTLSRVL